MNIAVYCGSNLGNETKYAKIAQDLGTWIGSRHHTLVYGGGKRGLMGVVADAVLSQGGKVIGVLPQVKEIQERKHRYLTQYIETENLARRKEKMIELSDAFIALPGGPGTLDEISDVISLSRLNEIQGACVLYDLDGFYQPLKEFYDQMADCGFVEPETLQKVLYSEDLEEIIQFIQKEKENV